jgi:hypothetical protein
VADVDDGDALAAARARGIVEGERLRAEAGLLLDDLVEGVRDSLASGLHPVKVWGVATVFHAARAGETPMVVASVFAEALIRLAGGQPNG